MSARIFLKQGDTVYDFLRVEQGGDGSLYISVLRRSLERDQPMMWDQNQAQFAPNPNARGGPRRISYHTTGRVNYGTVVTSPPRYFEPLFEITQRNAFLLYSTRKAPDRGPSGPLARCSFTPARRCSFTPALTSPGAGTISDGFARSEVARGRGASSGSKARDFGWPDDEGDHGDAARHRLAQPIAPRSASPAFDRLRLWSHLPASETRAGSETAPVTRSAAFGNRPGCRPNRRCPRRSRRPC